jgi:hypothetical protein
MIHGEQGAQRQQLFFTERLQMIGDELSEMRLAIFLDTKAAVILRQSFIKPGGHVAGSVIDQQMHVFVIDNAKRILCA